MSKEYMGFILPTEEIDVLKDLEQKVGSSWNRSL